MRVFLFVCMMHFDVYLSSISFSSNSFTLLESHYFFSRVIPACWKPVVLNMTGSESENAVVTNVVNEIDEASTERASEEAETNLNVSRVINLWNKEYCTWNHYLNLVAGEWNRQQWKSGRRCLKCRWNGRYDNSQQSEYSHVFVEWLYGCVDDGLPRCR